MTSERDIVDALLDAASVPQDGTLVVHCGFRGLSQAGYRVEPFIEAMLARMNGGNLLMPAMSWRSVNPSNPFWDELTTPSHVGVLAEVFRTHYAQKRSIHPTHSACAYGPATLALLDGHYLDETPCSVNSPWGRLAASDAHILMIGIGFERCTAIHHAEEMVVPDIYLQPPSEAETCRCTTSDGTVFDHRFRRHRKLEQDFPQYGPRLARLGQLKSGRIGDIPWTAVAARDLMADAFNNLAAQPDAHIRSRTQHATPA